MSNLITTTKDSYFINLGNKSNDPQTSPKTYWSIFKRFLNKIKIPTIPPLLVKGTFETGFRKKAGMFNIFFADQCSTFNNGSVLPVISYKTHKRLTNITISPEDFSRMINDLNPNKAHGHDNISIKMIQICIYCYLSIKNDFCVSNKITSFSRFVEKRKYYSCSQESE